MEESKILDQYKSETPVEKTSVENSDKTTDHKTDGLMSEGMNSLYSFFDISETDKTDSVINERLKVILEYASKGAKDRVDMLFNLKTIESRLGSQPITQTRLDHLHNYIFLLNKAEEARKEAELYER